MPLPVTLTHSMLMTAMELERHLSRRRSRLLLPVAEQSFFPLPDPTPNHGPDHANLSFSMVSSDPGNGEMGQWLKIKVRWCAATFIVFDHQCLWFDEMDPEHGDHLERPPSGCVRF